MSEKTNTRPKTAGEIKEAGADTAAGAIETSTQSSEVSHLNHIEPTQAADSLTASTSPADRAVRWLPIEYLQYHPLNQQIYGLADGSDLIETIAEHGVLEPLVVTRGNVVLSGHRRLAACRKVGITEVPAVIVDPADEITATDLLLAANAQRIKTNEQLAREASARMRIEQEKARRRQVEAGSSKLPAKSPEAGDARAIVAKQMGIGQKKVDQYVKVVEKLDELERDGNKEAFDGVTHALGKSVNKAANKVLVLNERAKLAASASIAAEAISSGTVIKADIITRLQEDLAEGMENWTEESLLAFEKVLAEFKASWFDREGEEEA